MRYLTPDDEDLRSELELENEELKESVAEWKRVAKSYQRINEELAKLVPKEKLLEHCLLKSLVS
jgi:hypothetical protein